MYMFLFQAICRRIWHHTSASTAPRQMWITARACGSTPWLQWDKAWPWFWEVFWSHVWDHAKQSYLVLGFKGIVHSVSLPISLSVCLSFCFSFLFTPSLSRFLCLALLSVCLPDFRSLYRSISLSLSELHFFSPFFFFSIFSISCKQ